MNQLVKIITGIAEYNNTYRDTKISPIDRLCAMWMIGDTLLNLDIEKPHSIGWQIQKETKGLIKRPTIFRSYKVRKLWPSLNQLKSDLGELRGMSNFIEMLPIIDPEQIVRKAIGKAELKSIYKHACSEAPRDFKKYLSAIKLKYSHGRLGSTLDKEKNLKGLIKYVDDFKYLFTHINNLIFRSNPEERNAFRASISQTERMIFSNMCLSLTTQGNIRLYKGSPIKQINCPIMALNNLFEYFIRILEKKSDDERARLRRLISADHLSKMADMISSLNDEDSINNFKMRDEIAIDL